MNGKICMVTGATAGIGEITAHALAEKGATVIVVGRSRDKCVAVVDQIKQKSGNQNVEYMLADLSVQKDVRALAEQFKAKYQQLHVLVNNAGAVILSRQTSADGIEMTFALNHLNYFLLTNLLLDVIKASAPARIVNVSSDVHRGAQINFEDVENKKRYNGLSVYSQSKLANVLFTYELARRLQGTGVTVNALHPGVVATNFATNNGFIGKIFRRVINLMSISPEEGAKTQIYLASSPEVEGVTGKYFDKSKDVPSDNASYNIDDARRLWQISEQMTSLTVPA